ncbi:MAG TPA: hypothetical protein PLQ44_00405 [Candidatus Paceibacterota bacterium]|jgi:hypothetical protein|nr:hypothetical protein [Candidatus Paceibacterota bacterium]HPT40059.1 hypothetical protein [Candidatus Paceibacterota bacterium]
MITLIIGFVGASLVLIAFIFNENKKWGDGDFKYDLANCIGGLFLVIYGVLSKTWPFVVLNTVWFLVSLRDVIKGIRGGGVG